VAGQLSAFLEAAASKPYALGSHDCMLLPADWVLAVTGRDPAAAWRGRYGARRDLVRILGDAGGLPALAASGAKAAGLTETEEPRPGDVGVVMALTAEGDKPVGAICVGAGRWAALKAAGVEVAAFEPVKAWRVA
jgi:hypothetical protein